MFPDNRLVKEQMETGKSQETLDSVGLQSSSVKEADDLESRTGEGTVAFWTFSSLWVCRVAFLALAVSHLHLHSSPIVSL